MHPAATGTDSDEPRTRCWLGLPAWYEMRPVRGNVNMRGSRVLTATPARYRSPMTDQPAVMTTPPARVVASPSPGTTASSRAGGPRSARPEPEELAYYRAAIERFGQPALDLGCGRDGCSSRWWHRAWTWTASTSPPTCWTSPPTAVPPPACALEGRLARQAFHDLDRPRRYGTIYCCDSFGIGGSREHDEPRSAGSTRTWSPAARSCSASTCCGPRTRPARGSCPRPPGALAGRRQAARLAGGDELELDVADGGLGRRLALRDDGDPGPPVARRLPAR